LILTLLNDAFHLITLYDVEWDEDCESKIVKYVKENIHGLF